jgi:hypothetical protein
VNNFEREIEQVKHTVQEAESSAIAMSEMFDDVSGRVKFKGGISGTGNESH